MQVPGTCGANKRMQQLVLQNEMNINVSVGTAGLYEQPDATSSRSGLPLLSATEM